MDLTLNRTIFKSLSDTAGQEPGKPVHGEVSFVVIPGRKGEVKDYDFRVVPQVRGREDG